jgi:hypothetical protein
LRQVIHFVGVRRFGETQLGFRQIGVVREEYAVSSDGMRMFGVMDLSSGFDGCRFAIGLRNSHDKSFRLSCTVGLRVFVCENLAFHGEYASETMFPNSQQYVSRSRLSAVVRDDGQSSTLVAWVQLLSPPPLSCLLSIAYRHFLISYNSVLQGAPLWTRFSFWLKEI